MAFESAIATVPATAPLERIDKPWGEELILTRASDSIVKMLRINPNCRLSLQFHRRKHETLMLLNGDAELTLGPSATRLTQTPLVAGTQVSIPPQTVHRLSAGRQGADILEVASRVPDDAEDIVRLADDYGRAALFESS